MKNYDKIQKWKIENGYYNLSFNDSGLPTDHEDWLKEFRKFVVEINRRKGTLNPDYVKDIKEDY